jgi:hypothetical protein
MIMDFLREEFESWRRTLPESAVPALAVFPLPEGADKQSARVRVETPARIADLLVWDSGEADLMAASLVTGEIEVMENAEVTSRFGIRGLLEDLARAVGDVG